MTDSTPRWRQLNLTCENWRAAEEMGIAQLGPLLRDAQDEGLIGIWWLVRKGDTWRIRIQSAPMPFVNSLTAALAETAAVRSWATTIYEPETHAFGGDQAMELAHDLFHADSRHLLQHLAAAHHNYRRELAIVLATRLLRAAELDFYEQGDCWNQLFTHRSDEPTEPTPRILAAVERLITATADTSSSPLHAAPAWGDAFDNAGKRLARLAAQGLLTRGLRAVLTHHLLFLFNRHGVASHDQALLASAASRVIFGPFADTSDTSPTTATSNPDTATLGPVTADTADLETHAAQLRNGLADYIASWDTFQTPQVEQAFRTVPRHLFLPDIDLETAYGPKPVVTRRAADGTSTSSASSPKLVATMLEQLAAQPGHRVLEIGAATGINAALLSELVGSAGTVVTIELDDDLAASAAKSLEAAGYPEVKVICGDGALGHPEQSPYDGIIVTAEAWDIVPGWWDQLTVGGRLVVPLRLHGSGLTRAIAFHHRQRGVMVSDSASVCGFVPMRGTAEHGENQVPLTDDVLLKVDTADEPETDLLTEVLTHPPDLLWTGIPVRHDEPAEHLDLWLACRTANNFGRLSVTAQARSSGLADPAMRWAGASIFHGDTLAYLTTRDTDDETLELGITAHGPDHTVTEELDDLLHQWHQQRPSQPTITAHRTNEPTHPRTAATTLSRPHSLITIEW